MHDTQRNYTQKRDTRIKNTSSQKTNRPTNVYANTLRVLHTRVLHGPGIGPRARPARSPWAGPGFYDILRAGPGAGLKLAGPSRARAGK